MSDNIFFITGRGRSGTWLLKSVLDYHKDVCVAPESLFIETLYKKYEHTNNWTTNIKNKFYADLIEDDRLLSWWKLDLPKLKGQIEKQDESSSYADYCLIPYKLYAKQNGNIKPKLLGDKNPGYSLRLRELLKLFPDTKVIILIRDPRDNVLSYMNVDFDLQNPIALAQRWKLYLYTILKVQREYPEKIKIYRFEDLIAQPKKTLSNMCDYLNLEYHDELLDFYKSPKNVFSWNQKITSPFDNEAIYKWEKQSDQTETLLKVGKVCKDLILQFGYKPPSKVVNLNLKDQYNILKATIITKLEKIFFHIPVYLKTKIIRVYRTLTKSL